MLSPRAIAVQGVGSVVLAFALQGLVGVEESVGAGGGGAGTHRIANDELADHVRASWDLLKARLTARATVTPAPPAAAPPKPTAAGPALPLVEHAAAAEPVQATRAVQVQPPAAAAHTASPAPSKVAATRAVSDTSPRGARPLQTAALDTHLARAAAFEDDALALLIILAEATA